MPALRKHSRPPRPTNLNFKNIRPKLHGSPITSSIWNDDGLRLGGVNNCFVQNPAGNGPVPGGSGQFGTDNTASLPMQGLFPAGNLSNSLSPMQTGGLGPEGATVTAPSPSSARLPEGRIYAVSVGRDPPQPLCAVFNSQTDKSCVLARVAERLPGVIIRDTTPAQRCRWYSTPAGQVYGPQRFAVLDLRAFDPIIPTVELTMLLLENDGPIEGVHVYLGRAVFNKLAERRISLGVREIVDLTSYSNSFGTMNRAWGQNPNGEMPDPSTVAYSGGPGPSNSSRFGPVSFPTSFGPPSSSSYDLPENMSAKTSIFSEPLGCTTTISSLGSIVSPPNAMDNYMKNPANDVFTGHSGLESAAHDGDFDSDIINPAVLSMSGAEEEQSEQDSYDYIYAGLGN
ncbi:hypothetical protein DL765_004372 [Monosporascus sp. GIB2]|nr:hypothetical protein DL765_004372 [Monosporascus sp. GIB2]